MKYDEDLEYAKKVYTVIEACVSNEILKSKYVTVDDNTEHDPDFYLRYDIRLEGDRSSDTIITYTCAVGLSDEYYHIIRTGDLGGIISYEDTAQKLFYYVDNDEFDIDGVIDTSWDSPEQHFQNSLLFDEYTNRSVLVLKYLKVHLPKNITYLRLEMGAIEKAYKVLMELRNAR